MRFAGEHEKPKRAADELDCHVEQADGARGAVDDESEDAAGCDRVEEKHSPDCCHVPPRRGEGGDDAENGHAEIESHDRREHLVLVGALDYAWTWGGSRQGRCRSSTLAA